MLQQTRVQTVLPYYERFMRELPTVRALAEAPEEQVLALWSGLGYYRRARMLQTAARRVAAEHGGRIPEEENALRELEGVGPYTAGAIASIAFGRRAALVDGNVSRVLARIFAVDDDVKTAAGSARIWRLARRLVEAAVGNPGDWNQALMELGATVCTPRDPLCASCPVRMNCRAVALGAVYRLPRTGQKTPPRRVERATVVLASSRAVLLARRTKGTLWGGLWEPPSAEGEIACLAESLDLDVRSLESAGEVVHILSHRRMRVQVASGPLPKRKVWNLPGPDYDAIEPVALEHIARRAHSTLARKVLIMAKVAFPSLLWKA